MARRKKTQARAEEIRAKVVEPVDPLAEFADNKVEYYLAKFFHMIRSNFKEFVMVLLLVVTVIIGITVYSVWSENRELESLQAYENLIKKPHFQKDSLNKSKALKDILKYEEQYGNFGARMRARVRKIQLLVDTDQPEKAADLAIKVSGELSHSEQRAFFYLKGAILYEDAARYKKAAVAYKHAKNLIAEENYIKAFALFGEGRSLIRSGNEDEGRRLLQKMMEMKGINEINRMRIDASVFLLSPTPAAGDNKKTEEAKR